MILKDYVKQLRLEPNNIELKKEFLKACYDIYLKAGGSEMKLRFLAYNEDIGADRIRKNAITYMVNNLGITKESYLINIIFEYLSYYNYDDKILKNLDITRLVNKNIYKDTFNLLTEDNKKKFVILVSKIKQMMCLIENGIKTNNGIRKFDIIDFFELLRMDLMYIDRICKYCNFNTHEITLYKHFVGINNFENTKIEVINFINNKQEFYLKKDEKNNLISGSGIILSKEIKEKIIEYLNELRKQLNHKNLMLASKRYIDGTLFTNNNVKIKKLK